MVVDMESGREIYLDPDAARENYRRDFDAHASQLQTICDSLGVDLYRMVTDQSMDDALFHIVDAQQRRGKSTARSGMISGATRTGGAG